MKLKYLGIYILIAFVLLITFLGIKLLHTKPVSKEMSGMVMGYQNNILYIQDEDNVIHTFSGCKPEEEIINVLVKYNVDSKDCLSLKAIRNNDIPIEYDDNGIFSVYYKLAYEKLKSLSIEEKIGQLLLARYPNNPEDIMAKYKVAGFVFYEKDFKDKTKKNVQDMLKNLQTKANIPLLTAVDEEGGKIIRVSSNKNLVATPFLSPSELYQQGGFDLIKEDTINKSKILKELGLNVNLAPVVDVSTSKNDYIYERTLQEDTAKVAEYAKTVLSASQNTGVSYVLKHFPGYGSATDTHYSAAVSDISYEDLKNVHLPPFIEGINNKAEAILVNHIIVNSVDEDNPASLSYNVHNLLKDDLNFTGVTISDDLAMGATSAIENAPVKALLAGNDMLIVTDVKESFEKIKEGLANNNLNENLINKLTFKVLAWKYYKGLMYEYEK